MFIYVTDEHTKDKLLELGCNLLKTICRAKGEQMYVFENDERVCFSECDKSRMVFSDTIVL